MSKSSNKTIFSVLYTASVGDKLTDGKRTWKVVDDEKNGGDCTIAIPIKSQWPKKESRFELWGDAQSQVSFIPNLKVIKSKNNKKDWSKNESK